MRIKIKSPNVPDTNREIEDKTKEKDQEDMDGWIDEPPSKPKTIKPLPVNYHKPVTTFEEKIQLEAFSLHNALFEATEQLLASDFDGTPAEAITQLINGMKSEISGVETSPMQTESADSGNGIKRKHAKDKRRARRSSTKDGKDEKDIDGAKRKIRKEEKIREFTIEDCKAYQRCPEDRIEVVKKSSLGQNPARFALRRDSSPNIRFNMPDGVSYVLGSEEYLQSLLVIVIDTSKFRYTSATSIISKKIVRPYNIKTEHTIKLSSGQIDKYHFIYPEKSRHELGSPEGRKRISTALEPLLKLLKEKAPNLITASDINFDGSVLYAIYQRFISGKATSGRVSISAPKKSKSIKKNEIESDKAGASESGEGSEIESTQDGEPGGELQETPRRKRTLNKRYQDFDLKTNAHSDSDSDVEMSKSDPDAEYHDSDSDYSTSDSDNQDSDLESHSDFDFNSDSDSYSDSGSDSNGKTLPIQMESDNEIERIDAKDKKGTSSPLIMGGKEEKNIAKRIRKTKEEVKTREFTIQDCQAYQLCPKAKIEIVKQQSAVQNPAHFPSSDSKSPQIRFNMPEGVSYNQGSEEYLQSLLVIVIDPSKYKQNSVSGIVSERIVRPYNCKPENIVKLTVSQFGKYHFIFPEKSRHELGSPEGRKRIYTAIEPLLKLLKEQAPHLIKTSDINFDGAVLFSIYQRFNSARSPIVEPKITKTKSKAHSDSDFTIEMSERDSKEKDKEKHKEKDEEKAMVIAEETGKEKEKNAEMEVENEKEKINEKKKERMKAKLIEMQAENNRKFTIIDCKAYQLCPKDKIEKVKNSKINQTPARFTLGGRKSTNIRFNMPNGVTYVQGGEEYLQSLLVVVLDPSKYQYTSATSIISKKIVRPYNCRSENTVKLSVGQVGIYHFIIPEKSRHELGSPDGRKRIYTAIEPLLNLLKKEAPHLIKASDINFDGSVLYSIYKRFTFPRSSGVEPKKTKSKSVTHSESDSDSDSHSDFKKSKCDSDKEDKKKDVVKAKKTEKEKEENTDMQIENEKERAFKDESPAAIELREKLAEFQCCELSDIEVIKQSYKNIRVSPQFSDSETTDDDIKLFDAKDLTFIQGSGTNLQSILVIMSKSEYTYNIQKHILKPYNSNPKHPIKLVLTRIQDFYFIFPSKNKHHLGSPEGRKKIYTATEPLIKIINKLLKSKEKKIKVPAEDLELKILKTIYGAFEKCDNQKPQMSWSLDHATIETIRNSSSNQSLKVISDGTQVTDVTLPKGWVIQQCSQINLQSIPILYEGEKDQDYSRLQKRLLQPYNNNPANYIKLTLTELGGYCFIVPEASRHELLFPEGRQRIYVAVKPLLAILESNKIDIEVLTEKSDMEVWTSMQEAIHSNPKKRSRDEKSNSPSIEPAPKKLKHKEKKTDKQKARRADTQTGGKSESSEDATFSFLFEAISASKSRELKSLFNSSKSKSELYPNAKLRSKVEKSDQKDDENPKQKDSEKLISMDEAEDVAAGEQTSDRMDLLWSGAQTLFSAAKTSSQGSDTQQPSDKESGNSPPKT